MQPDAYLGSHYKVRWLIIFLTNCLVLRHGLYAYNYSKKKQLILAHYTVNRGEGMVPLTNTCSGKLGDSLVRGLLWPRTTWISRSYGESLFSQCRKLGLPELQCMRVGLDIICRHVFVRMRGKIRCNLEYSCTIRTGEADGSTKKTKWIYLTPAKVCENSLYTAEKKNHPYSALYIV